jgi:hypothetical protein
LLQKIIETQQIVEVHLENRESQCSQYGRRAAPAQGA